MSVNYIIDQPKRGVFQFTSVLIAGAAGVASALVADFVQKGEASAIFVLNAMLFQHLALSLPPLYLAAGLMLAGAITVFIFEPRNKRSAFYTGASILAVLWTGMPADTLEGVAPEIIDEGPAIEEPASFDGFNTGALLSYTGGCAQSFGSGAFVIPASFGATCTNSTPSWQPYVTQVAAKDRLPVKIQVLIPGHDSVPPITARLYDSVSGKKWDLSSTGRARRMQKGYLVTYSTSLRPDAESQDVANLYVRIEAPGYKITQGNVRVSRTERAVDVPFILEKSGTPLWLQRLRTPHRF